MRWMMDNEMVRVAGWERCSDDHVVTLPSCLRILIIIIIIITITNGDGSVWNSSIRLDEEEGYYGLPLATKTANNQ